MFEKSRFEKRSDSCVDVGGNSNVREGFGFDLCVLGDLEWGDVANGFDVGSRVIK